SFVRAKLGGKDGGARITRRNFDGYLGSSSRKIPGARRSWAGPYYRVSDDDPSGIATYSQVGAQFGFSISWTMLFSYPLMAAIQEISGRIGRTTGRGIAGNIRRHYPAWL